MNPVQRDSKSKAIVVLWSLRFFGVAVIGAGYIVSTATICFACEHEIASAHFSPLRVSICRISSSLAAATNRFVENAHSRPSL